MLNKYESINQTKKNKEANFGMYTRTAHNEKTL